MKLTVRQKSNWLFAQITLISLALVAIFVGLFYKIFNFTLAAIGAMALGKAEGACGCQIAAGSSFSITTGLIVVVGVAILISFLLAISKILFTIIKTKKFVAAQKINFTGASTKLEQVANNIGIGKQVVEISSARPLIFCYGLQRPKIYISSAVVQTLSYAELQAVLLHETHHMLSQEPARLLLIKFMSTFNFIPGIKNISKKYLSFSEMAADELATGNFTDKNHLASAMAKILEMEETDIIQKELAVSYFSQITEERVLALSDSDYVPTFKKEALKTTLSVLGVTVVFFLIGFGIKAQQTHAQELYSGSGCADKIYFERCDNAWSNCANKIFHQPILQCRNQKGDKSYLQ